MPMIDADGCLLNVSVEGRDRGPTLMLSNSLGSTLEMWEPQMKALTQLFRVIRYDRRGHGKSSVPPGPYSMERFGRDVLAILDDLNIEKTHWCGLSMGGMIGQWLGANAPERFGKLVLANTACYYPDPTNWLNRIKAVTEGGVASVADTEKAGRNEPDQPRKPRGWGKSAPAGSKFKSKLSFGMAFSVKVKSTPYSFTPPLSRMIAPTEATQLVRSR